MSLDLFAGLLSSLLIIIVGAFTSALAFTFIPNTSRKNSFKLLFSGIFGGLLGLILACMTESKIITIYNQNCEESGVYEEYNLENVAGLQDIFVNLGPNGPIVKYIDETGAVKTVSLNRDITLIFDGAYKIEIKQTSLGFIKDEDIIVHL